MMSSRSVTWEGFTDHFEMRKFLYKLLKYSGDARAVRRRRVGRRAKRRVAGKVAGKIFRRIK